MLFAVLDTAPRRVICPTRRRHRNSELLQFLRTIKALVTHNQKTHRAHRAHKAPAIRRWEALHAKLHVHFKLGCACRPQSAAGWVTGLPRTPVCAARTHRRAWTNARTALGLVQSPIWIGRGWRAMTASVWASGRSNGRRAACCESARPCRLGITACPGRTGQAAGACQRRRRSISDQSRTQQQCRSLWAPDQP